MPLVFDSVLVGALARELHDRWAGRRLEALRFDREARAVRVEFADERWIWLLHPLHGTPLPVAMAPGVSEDVGWRRDEGRGLLEGPRRIVSIDSPTDTRVLVLALDGPERTRERIAFDLAANRWNALHLVEGRVAAILVPDLGRSPARPGDEWSAPRSDRRWADAPPDEKEWIEGLEELIGPDGGRPRRHVAWLSGMNEAAVFEGEPDEALADPEAREASLARYLRLRAAALRDPPEGWLLPEEGDGDGADGADLRPYACSLDRPGAERIGSVLDALAAFARRSPEIMHALRTALEPEETTRLREALEARRDRAAKKIRALEAEVDTVRDPEELRQLGHLLLARKSEIPSGAEEVRLESFTGETVRLELDPTLDAIGNAEAYYDRAKRLERAAAELPKRIQKARRKVAAYEEGLERLARDGPDDALWKLAGGRRQVLGSGGGRGRGDRAERLPYRVYRTSSGREIRAGRSAKGNDDLTFHHSAPEDIWLHVRQAPGSHVILRWGRTDQNPPESDIAEAALVAAVHSQARGSRVVPVAWTRRKYVRKPRKAGPGTVVPERTETVFVRPDVGRVKEMAEAD